MRPWRVWTTALVLLLLFAIAGLLPCDSADDRLRWVGLGLQILSLVVVWVGIGKTLTEFNRPTLLTSVWLLLRDARQFLFPRRGRIIELKASGSISLGGSASATLSFARQKTQEERIAELENGLQSLQAEVSKKHSELAEQIRTGDASVRAALESEVKEVESRLRVHAVGGLYEEMMGLIWLVTGVILATVPEIVVEGMPWLGGCK